MDEEQEKAFAADRARDEARELRMMGIDVPREMEQALMERWLARVKNAKR